MWKKVYYSVQAVSLRDPLLRSATLITTTSAVNMGAGFLFWLITARLCANEDVGIASSLFALMSFVVLLSKLGLDYALVRYLPGSDRGEVFGTVIVIVATTTLAVTSALWVLLGEIAPALGAIRSPAMFIVFFVSIMAWSLVSLFATLFVAVRQSGKYLVQTAFVGIRCLLIFPLASFSAIGILSTVGLSYLMALVVSLLFMFRIGVVPILGLSREFIERAIKFSLANYASSLLVIGSSLVLPTIVLSILGAEQAAYYFIAFSLMSILLIVPNSVGASLFVEGSHGRRMEVLLRKNALPIIAGMVTPASLLYFFGGDILTLFGAGYSENAIELLRVLAVSSILVGFVYSYLSVCRVRKDSRALLILSGVTSSGLVLSAISCVSSFGLIGLGYAWMMSYSLGAFLVIYLELKRRGTTAG